jgi:acyl-CoA dehydrogenase
VYGGMGYVEETGVAQLLRDARITSIYEGTTAIQANDLVYRKLLKDHGAALRSTLGAMQGTVLLLSSKPGEEFAAIRTGLAVALEALTHSAMFLIAQSDQNPRVVAAGSVPFLMLLGVCAGGWQLSRAAFIAAQRLEQNRGRREFLQGKILTARFYAEHILPKTQALDHAICQGSGALLAMPDEGF